MTGKLTRQPDPTLTTKYPSRNPPPSFCHIPLPPTYYFMPPGLHFLICKIGNLYSKSTSSSNIWCFHQWKWTQATTYSRPTISHSLPRRCSPTSLEQATGPAHLSRLISWAPTPFLHLVYACWTRWSALGSLHPEHTPPAKHSLCPQNLLRFSHLLPVPFRYT